jgi:hypothetical protein
MRWLIFVAVSVVGGFVLLAVTAIVATFFGE